MSKYNVLYDSLSVIRRDNNMYDYDEILKYFGTADDRNLLSNVS